MSISKTRKLENVTTLDIIDKLEVYGGCIAAVSDYYGTSREAIYQYINKRPEIKPLLVEIRSNKSEVDLDTAENVLRKCMEMIVENPKLAQDTAKYIIDKKGHSRGYSDRGQSKSQEETISQLEDISRWSKHQYDEISIKISDE